jgi:hypothetical protein
MRGFSIMSDEERQTILKQHATVYDGYATGNVTSNMTPLTVYDAAGDKGGVTVDNTGNVKTYTNHNVNESVNEITAKPLNYDEIDAAYEFDSEGPQQSMTQMGMGERPYEFVSKGPSDVYEYEEDFQDKSFEDLLDDESVLDQEETQLSESVNKSLDMFRRFKNFM